MVPSCRYHSGQPRERSCSVSGSCNKIYYLFVGWLRQILNNSN